MTTYHFDHIYTPDGWQRDRAVTIEAGVIVAVQKAAEWEGPATRISGIALPAIPNVHSHAFQRGFAGLAERRPAGKSDFWSWREAMYRFANAMTPERLEAIAGFCYAQAVRAGYSQIGEFHYVHSTDDGLEAEMTAALVRAADRARIGLTLLPVLYQASGFGNAPPRAEQKPFVLTIDRFARLLETPLEGPHNIGLAFHSLRAVCPDVMSEALSLARPGMPIHIHIAEQMQEVRDCLEWQHRRPVGWLLDHMPVNGDWCLIHATHADETELKGIALTGASVGLCLTTEANLGDGVFPFPDFMAAGGRFGIGSDSNVELCPRAELRLLEYGQRLCHERRTLTPGEDLWRLAATGGARALGLRAGTIAPGQRADLVIFDADHPALAGRPDAALIDTLIFAGGTLVPRDVMVAGRWSIQDGHLPNDDRITADYRRTLAEIAA